MASLLKTCARRGLLMTSSTICRPAVASSRMVSEKEAFVCRQPTWGLGARTGLAFSSSADTQLANTIQKELAHEESQFDADKDLANFVKVNGWKLGETPDDIMVSLTKEVDGRKVVVEFSCIQGGEGSTEDGPLPEMVDFTVTVTKPDNSGILLYCSTTHDEEDKHRYCIGQLRFFGSTEQKESLSSYPGPYFEDLDESFQQGLDEWLASHGISEELCDFIDKFSVEKENKEYLQWLKKIRNFVQ